MRNFLFLHLASYWFNGSFRDAGNLVRELESLYALEVHIQVHYFSCSWLWSDRYQCQRRSLCEQIKSYFHPHHQMHQEYWYIPALPLRHKHPQITWFRHHYQRHHFYFDLLTSSNQAWISSQLGLLDTQQMAREWPSTTPPYRSWYHGRTCWRESTGSDRTFRYPSVASRTLADQIRKSRF